MEYTHSYVWLYYNYIIIIINQSIIEIRGHLSSSINQSINQSISHWNIRIHTSDCTIIYHHHNQSIIKHKPLFDYQTIIEIYTPSYVYNQYQKYTIQYLIIKQSLHQIQVHTCSINSINIHLYQRQTIIWLSSKYWNIYTVIRVQSIPKIYVCTKYKPLFDYQTIIEKFTHSYVYNQSQKYTSIIWLSNNHYINYAFIRVQWIQ